MSHTTTITSVKITDTSALQSAIEELAREGVNCSLERDAKPRMYSSAQEKQCDYVLRLRDAEYDIGFQRQKDGSYAAMTDFFGGTVSKQLGPVQACAMPNTPAARTQAQMGRLFQMYAAHAAMNVARAAGHMVEGYVRDPKTGTVHVQVQTA